MWVLLFWPFARKRAIAINLDNSYKNTTKRESRSNSFSFICKGFCSEANERMAMSTTKEKEGRIEGSAKAHVADQISQAVQSTSNLLHLMHQSSPSQALLIKLPKNLLAKASTVKNTGQVLERMPRVISSLDAHMENGLRNVPHLKTVVQLLSNMETCQLNSASHVHRPREEEPS